MLDFFILMGLLFAWNKWDDQMTVHTDLLIEIRNELKGTDSVAVQQATDAEFEEASNKATASKAGIKERQKDTPPTVDRRKR